MYPERKDPPILQSVLLAAHKTCFAQRLKNSKRTENCSFPDTKAATKQSDENEQKNEHH
jgi:hypothetical protein